MAEFLGREYNFDVWKPFDGEAHYFKAEVVHAGDLAPAFTLPTLDGHTVSLSSLKGKPVVLEFGSIT